MRRVCLTTTGWLQTAVDSTIAAPRSRSLDSVFSSISFMKCSTYDERCPVLSSEIRSGKIGWILARATILMASSLLIALSQPGYINVPKISNDGNIFHYSSTNSPSHSLLHTNHTATTVNGFKWNFWRDDSSPNVLSVKLLNAGYVKLLN